MLIRPARDGDAGAAARVLVDTWHIAYRGLVPDSALLRMTYQRSEERLRASLASGSEETYLAVDDQTVVGLLTLGTCRDEDVDKTTFGEIWGIYVRPDHWRQGIGRRFVHIAEKLLAARGFEQATLWVLSGNLEARRFYEAMAYHPDGGTKAIVLGEPLEAVRYRKPLARVQEAMETKGHAPPPICIRTYVESPPEVVYETLATSSGWDAWFTQGAEVDARPGGWIHFQWVRFGAERISAEDGGPVLEAIPGARLVFQWNPRSDRGTTATTVAFDLEARGPGTAITVTESGHGTSEEDLVTYMQCAAGWGEALTLLKIYLEHGFKVTTW